MSSEKKPKKPVIGAKKKDVKADANKKKEETSKVADKKKTTSGKTEKDKPKEEPKKREDTKPAPVKGKVETNKGEDVKPAPVKGKDDSKKREDIKPAPIKGKIETKKQDDTKRGAGGAKEETKKIESEKLDSMNDKNKITPIAKDDDQPAQEKLPVVQSKSGAKSQEDNEDVYVFAADEDVSDDQFNAEEYILKYAKEMEDSCELAMISMDNIPINERKKFSEVPYEVKVGTGSTIPPNTQSQTNIGMIGHVDHGKTTLVKMMTTVETDRFNEEKTRGITIRLGYAVCTVMHCPKCGLFTSLEAAIRDKPKKWKKGNCPVCPNTDLDFQRRISFVDCPGHETLMATMLGGASLMDSAILLVAANQKCPQPQTREHLAAITIAGIKKIIIVQNKVDSVSKQQVVKNYLEIKSFVKGTIAENAPIIPVSSIFNANIDILIQKIEEIFTTPEYDEKDEFEMRIVRSFDVNKPGSEISKLQGGVLGGTIFGGQIEKDEEIEIRPGILIAKNKYLPITTTVSAIAEGRDFLDYGTPGGLKAIGTTLDPYYTKANSLIGSFVGRPGSMPDVQYEIEFSYFLFKRIVGAEKLMDVGDIKIDEDLMLVVETMTTIGRVKSIKKGKLVCQLLGRPICAKPNSLIAVNKRFNRVFRLIGWGILK